MPLAFNDMTWKNGQVNPSGIKTIAYWCYKDDIAAWPTAPADDPALAASTSGYVNYTGDFVMKSGKTFRRIYSTQGIGKATFEPTGDKDCKIFTNKATLKYPDLTDDSKALAKMGANSNIILIVPQPGKRFSVIGSDDYDVEVTPKGDTGDKPGSTKGLTIEVSAPDVNPLPNYVGDLALSDGSLDCSTGTFTASGTTTTTTV